MNADVRSQGEWRRGWLTLSGATGAAASGASLFLYSAGYFVKPLEASLGWSRTEIAFGSTVMMFMVALMMPVIGVIVDRLTMHYVGPIAFITYGIFCFILSLIPSALSLYYIVLFLLAVPFAGTMAPVFAPLVAASFMERRGVALGIMMSGAALMMVPFAPIIQQVISIAGWRAGYGLLGGMAIVVGLPFSILASRASHVSLGTKSEPATGLFLSQAVRTLNYWKLVTAVALCLLAVGGFLNQLPALVSDKGLGVVQVGLIGSIFVVCVILGRIGIGLLLDLLNPSAVAFGAMTAAAVGALLLLTADPSFLLCAIATCLIGLSMGAEGDFQAFFIARMFGLRALAGIFGTVGAVAAASLGCGSLLFGRIYDLMGNYDAALILAAILYFFSGILFANLKEKSDR